MHSRPLKHSLCVLQAVEVDLDSGLVASDNHGYLAIAVSLYLASYTGNRHLELMFLSEIQVHSVWDVDC